MEIGKFDVYLYDGVFYTEDELNELGLTYLDRKRMTIDLHPVIRFYQGEKLSYNTEWDYLDNCPDDVAFIKKQDPCMGYTHYTVLVSVRPYYGINYDGYSSVMENKQDRDRIYNQITMLEEVEQKYSAVSMLDINQQPEASFKRKKLVFNLQKPFSEYGQDTL